jgi:hypothetical protein
VSSHIPLIVLPGVHDQQCTQEFLALLKPLLPDRHIEVLPTVTNPAYCSVSILGFLWDRITIRSTPIMVIAFSAGVAGAIPALNLWQLQGGKVAGLIAIDGWGVPAVGNFPIYRLSHDYFTHWSSALLGAGEINFYADPPVEHLEMWRSPHTCLGWQVTSPNSPRTHTTALEFMIKIVLN